MAKSNITLPPKRKEETVETVQEKKISEVINKGGGTTKKEEQNTSADNPIKQMNIKLFESEVDSINILRDRRPRDRGKKIAISLHDWILEAVQEKIERENKKYKQS